jgi:hypothetical protein
MSLLLTRDRRRPLHEAADPDSDRHAILPRWPGDHHLAISHPGRPLARYRRPAPLARSLLLRADGIARPLGRGEGDGRRGRGKVAKVDGRGPVRGRWGQDRGVRSAVRRVGRVGRRAGRAREREDGVVAGDKMRRGVGSGPGCGADGRRQDGGRTMRFGRRWVQSLGLRVVSGVSMSHSARTC